MSSSSVTTASGQNDAEQPKTTEMREQLRQKLLTVIDEIDKGFRRSMLMYTVTFFFGIAIILFSIVSTVVYGQNTFNLIFGALGVLDIVAFLVFKPTEDLQRSRGNLAQLISAFLAWYSGITAWGYMNKKILDADNMDMSLLQESSKRALLDTIIFMAAIDFFVVGKQKEEQVKQIQSLLKDIQDRLNAK